MNFNKHLNLEGKHAFLSASKYHWLGYSEDKLITVYENWQAVQRGTELHNFAKDCIRLGIRLPRTQSTLNLYVNDAIGFRMQPQQPLVYSDNCFGTADAISFRKNELRIHDLKTGSTPASLKQLEIYTALFCLEYNKKPEKMKTILRIYQNNEIFEEEPSPEDIFAIMDKIIVFDKTIEKLKLEE